MGVLIAAFVGGALVAIAIALLGKLRLARAAQGRQGTGDRVSAKGKPGAGVCPICSSVLGPGERIKSDIYPGKGDRIMRIFGCPRCLPSRQDGVLGVPRVCPVCLKPLPPEGWLVARYFERPGRRHVHVLGCAACQSASGGARRS